MIAATCPRFRFYRRDAGEAIHSHAVGSSVLSHRLQQRLEDNPNSLQRRQKVSAREQVIPTLHLEPSYAPILLEEILVSLRGTPHPSWELGRGRLLCPHDVLHCTTRNNQVLQVHNLPPRSIPRSPKSPDRRCPITPHRPPPLSSTFSSSILLISYS